MYAQIFNLFCDIWNILWEVEITDNYICYENHTDHISKNGLPTLLNCFVEIVWDGEIHVCRSGWRHWQSENNKHKTYDYLKLPSKPLRQQEIWYIDGSSNEVERDPSER